MEIQINVRPYKKGDEEKIVELLELVFNGWPKFDLQHSSLEHWKWKYLENPYKINLTAVAELDNQIIGCWHRTTQKIKFGVKVAYSGQGQDVAVHPDHQGMGIASKLRKLTYDMSSKNNIPIILGVNTNPKLRKSALRRGAKDISNLIGMMKIYDINLHYRTPAKRYAYYIIKNIHKIDKLSRARTKNNHRNTFYIKNIKKFDKRINKFWEEIQNQYNFLVIKNEEYMNWRYSDPRGGNYVIKQAEDNDRILGYCILRINNYIKEYPVGYIVDLITIPHRHDVSEELIKESLQYFKCMNINSINTWTFKNESYNILKKHDFIRNRKLFLQYTPYDEMLTSPELDTIPSGLYHFSAGDSDTI